MGDANTRRPFATLFEHGVDFGLIVHKSSFMADEKDRLLLSNYIFELLEVNPGVAGFLIQLHLDDVDAVFESVTPHAEKGVGTKTTLYVCQEEEEEVEGGVEEVLEVGAGRGKDKPHNPLMIIVQKVRIRPGKGKGKWDCLFPKPLTHNTRQVCTDEPETKLPMHCLCPTREVEALQRRGDDLRQSLGLVEAEVWSPSSTLSTTFTAQQGLGLPRVQGQYGGSRSWCQ